MSNADIRGRFIWHELVTTDPDAAGTFYSKVVPWKTQPSGMPSYTLWMAGKTQVGGLTGLADDAAPDTPPHWIVYVATPNVDATVAEAQRLGGKVIKGGTDIPNMGRFAVLSDPQGATFAVYTPPSGPPPEGSGGGSGGPGEFTWHELATSDPEAALNFYVALFGWEKGPAHDMGAMGVYQLINHHGAQAGGIYKLQGSSTPPNWLSYVNVSDCSKATSAAKAAGARILNGPIEVPGGSWITQIMDPQGGAFAVVEAPKAAAAKPAAKADAAKAKADKPAAARKPEKAKAAAKSDTPAAAVSKPEPQAPTPEPVAVPAAAKKAPRKAPKKSGKAAAKKAVSKKKAAKKTPPKKSAPKKTSKAAAKKRPAAKRAAAKSTSAKRGKSAAKKGKAAKKAKRR